MNKAYCARVSNWRTTVGSTDGSLQSCAQSGEVDAYIVATEDGFSPLGMSLRFLSWDLGISVTEMKQLADWNRFQNPRVSLVALASRRSGSHLRGLILAPSESSECYMQFATPRYGRPYRDFYYNVTYEAIAYCVSTWRARHLAISPIPGSGRFHEDVVTCNAEALAHYCEAHENAVDTFLFHECPVRPEYFAHISRLNVEGQSTTHRPITTEISNCDGHVLVHMKWSGDV